MTTRSAGPRRGAPAGPKRAASRKAARRRRAVVVLALLAVFGGAAVVLFSAEGRRGRQDTLGVAPGAAAGFNLLLVTLDTTRGDRIGCYGYEGAETPVLDALAKQGARVADAVSPVPMTLPAHASVLTGEYPPRHGVRSNGTYRLAEDRATLTKRLKERGYRTAAFLGAFVLDRRYGLARDFDVYEDRFEPVPSGAGPAHDHALNPERAADRVVDAALAWFSAEAPAGAGSPWFAWVHLFDPHAPYAAPEPFRSRFARSPYDGEVAFMDQQLGRLLDGLRGRGDLERTLVVALGDHGEGLGEHGESTHSLLIYEATMRVPLIFHAPAVLRGPVTVAGRPVSLVDVAPTVLELLGLPPGEGDGASLLRPAPAGRDLYLESLAPQLNHGWSPLYAVRRGRLKYIQAPVPELYDLDEDPGETKNLYRERSAEAAALAQGLAELTGGMPGGSVGLAVEMDAEARRQLEALGYISGAAPAPGGAPADPKEMIARFDEHLRHANDLVAAKRFAEAIPLLKGLLANSPNDPSLWSLASLAHAQAGELDEAISARLRAVELQPGDASAWILLARLQDAKGDSAGCAHSLAESERLEPEGGAASLLRAHQAIRAKRYDEAMRWAKEAERRDPMRSGAESWLIQGKVHQEQGRPAEAQAAYERSRAAAPK